MKRALGPILLVALMFLVAFWLLFTQFVGSLAQEKVDTFLISLLGKGYVVYLLVILIIGSFISAYFIVKQSAFFSSLTQREEKKEESYSEQIRKILIDKYSNRLDQKLASRQPANLTIIPSTVGMSEMARESLKNKIFKAEYKVKELKGGIKKIFEESGGRLLVTGDPGSGKTTLMLQLAMAHLEEGKLAVLANLATWKPNYKTLDRWLEEVLPYLLSASPKLAKQVFTEENPVLVLDGLDEVPLPDRPSLLEAIGKYGENSKRRFVISSRVEDFVKTKHDAPVYGQVNVEPLSEKQIINTLKEWSHNQEPGASRLLREVKEDPILAKAILTPIFFNSVLLALAANPNQPLEFKANNLEGRKKEIISRFVGSRVQETKLGRKDKSRKEVNRWLSFIASRMERNKLVDFELIYLQVDWWRWSRWQRLVFGFINFFLYGFIFGMLSFSMFLVIGGLFFSEVIVFDIYYNSYLYPTYDFVDILKLFRNMKILGNILLLTPFSFLIGWLIGGTIVGLIGGVSLGIVNKDPKIESVDVIIWPNTFKLNPFSILFIFLIGFIVTLVLMILIDLEVMSSENYSGKPLSFDELLIDYLTTSSITEVLPPAFSISLFFLAIKVIIKAINLIRSPVSLSLIQSSYHRFNSSARNLWFSILQHLHLKYLLYRKGLLPWRLVEFLKEMTKRNILESDGASWRFRHRVIQDFFVEEWEKMGLEPEVESDDAQKEVQTESQN